ncbi:MAG: FG-GAP-like repeat-containing protein [Gemmatimonadota bacterium]
MGTVAAWVGEPSARLRFVDASAMIEAPEPGTGGIAWLDADDDGRLDLAVATAERNRLFLNRRDGTFEEVGEEAGLGAVRHSFIPAAADFDGDGFLDLVFSNGWSGREGLGGAELYRNAGNGNHWIAIELEGANANTGAIGASVHVVTSRQRLTRHADGGNGYGGGGRRVHFGLGSADGVDSLIIRWPSGRVTARTGLETDRVHRVVEPAGPTVTRLRESSEQEIAGTYRTGAGELIVIARSGARPTYYRPASGEVRALFADSTGRYRAGPGLLVRDSTEFTVEFLHGGERAQPGQVDALLIRAPDGAPVRARKVRLYDTEPVEFRGGRQEEDVAEDDDAGHPRLAGTLFRPAGTGPYPAVVLVHGSGPQDRWGPFGYASIVADHFARAGFAVLAFDKRGVGGSTGDWRTANFDALADDVTAAVRWLAARPDIRTDAIGLWGISQAGWVAARATTSDPPPSFVILFSAAGAGITVGEQNLYNITAELEARGSSERVIDRARLAWRRLYALADRGGRAVDPVLDSLVTDLRGAGVPTGLLPPLSGEVDWDAGDAWFLTLPLDFDPIPLWRAYGGRVLAAFGERDAATPTARVLERLRPIARRSGDRVGTHVFQGADHFMLASRTGSVQELSELRRFVPDVFGSMTRWAWTAVADDAAGARAPPRFQETTSTVGLDDLAVGSWFETPGRGLRLFRNADGRFAERSAASGLSTTVANGATSADMDDDGDVDLFLTNRGPPPDRLCRNRSNSNRWLHLDLVGSESNRSAIGARVEAYVGDLRIVREVTGGNGYGGGSR